MVLKAFFSEIKVLKATQQKGFERPVIEQKLVTEILITLLDVYEVVDNLDLSKATSGWY